MDEIDEAMKCDRKFMGKENRVFFLKEKKKIFLIFLGSRYVELYFDSPHASSSNHRPSKNHDSPHHSSHSPSKPKDNIDSRSRSMCYLFFLIKKKYNSY